MSERLDIGVDAWQRVSRRYVVVDALAYLVSGLIATAVSFVPWVVLHWSWAWMLPLAVGAVALVVVVLTPRRVRAIGYRLRDDDLLARRGLAWQRFIAVPYGRMQLVDVTRGPVARALGLAELRLVTAAASSTVVIPGLPIAEAEALRDRLVALAETRRAGL